ncbi:hypothetical protein FOL46_002883, partial [Perkinsus olseni]
EFNHAGVPKIREELSKHYYWPGMDRDIGSYISTCEICLQVKPNAGKSYKHTGSLTKSLTKPMERLYFDVTHPHSLLGPVLTIIDGFSRYAFAFELVSGENTNSVIKVFTFYFSLYPLPQEVFCDNSAVFKSARLQRYFTERNVRLRYSIPNQPETNGVVERYHRLLRQSILCLQLQYQQHHLQANHRLVVSWLARAVHVHNSISHSVSHRTPASLFFGNSLLWNSVNEAMQKDAPKNNDNNRLSLSVGDLVLKKVKYSAFPQTTPLFGAKRFVVSRILSPSRIEIVSLDDNNEAKVVHPSQVRLLPPSADIEDDDTIARKKTTIKS